MQIIKPDKHSTNAVNKNVPQRSWTDISGPAVQLIYVPLHVSEPILHTMSWPGTCVWAAD